MPASKTKRKNGKKAKGGFQSLCRARRTAQFKSRTPEQLRKWVGIEADRCATLRARIAKVYALTCIKADPGAVRDQFLKAQFSMRRLSETKQVEDFNLIASTMMLGFLVLHAVNDENDENTNTIREGAFGLTKVLRARNRGEPIDPSDLQTAHRGLDMAQYALEWSIENDMNALAKAFQFNTPDFRRLHPEEYRDAERALLGEYADTVFQWEEEELNNEQH